MLREALVFIKCSTNNRADTVYDSFLRGVQSYGLQSRLRCDQGLENVRVAQHMIHHRGSERRSVLVGASVHNQRVERLWRDLHRCVTVTFYRLFYFLEQNDLLDPLDEVHLYSLHYVYLPQINRAIEHFKKAWNSHGIRTEKGMTPQQLFTAGALQLRESGISALDFFHDVNEEYGYEEEGLTPDSDNEIEVPATTVHLTDDQLSELRQSVDPLSDSEDFGINLYERTVHFVNSTVSA